VDVLARRLCAGQAIGWLESGAQFVAKRFRALLKRRRRQLA
jgi:hypothetical protein